MPDETAPSPPALFTPSSSPGKLRLFAAFAMLPVFDGLLAFVAFPMLPLLGNDSGYRAVDWQQPARAFGFVAGISGLFVTLCAAAPAFSWMRRRGPVSFGRTVLAGAVLGNLPFGVYLLFALAFTVAHIAAGTMSQHLMPMSSLLAGTARAIFIGTGLGATSAVAFWFAGIYGSDAAGTNP